MHFSLPLDCDCLKSISSHNLHLCNSDDSLMVFLSTAMPGSLRDNLFESLKGCFDGKAPLDDAGKETDAGNPKFGFHYIHFNLYNWYTTKVRKVMHSNYARWFPVHDRVVKHLFTFTQSIASKVGQMTVKECPICPRIPSTTKHCSTIFLNRSRMFSCGLRRW